ncbi:MAG: lysine--tRNA ligase [Actinomycetia bacterium]|nr:lysine--tRNA ligase [Actinomycetes bacterium]
MTNEPEPQTSPDADPATVEDDPVAVRRAKLDALAAAGVSAYATGLRPDTRSAALQERYAPLESGESSGEIASVAGRVIAIRRQGKIAFWVLRDGEGEIQLFLRQNTLGEAAYEFAKNLDVGDWVYARGEVLRTKTGELSLMPAELTLLAKSLRPLPEKFHGLTDTDARYRQRYVDLIANPEVRRAFEIRFRVIAQMRRFMDARGFLEVETPILHTVPGGAVAKPFITHHNTLDIDLYLRIAPELHLKRLLVGGFERVYEIGRCFRNEGMDTRHNPEFTTIEVYEAFGDMYSMMDLTEALVQSVASEVLGTGDVVYQGTQLHLGEPFARRTLAELVSAAAGAEVSVRTPIEELRRLAAVHHIATEPAWSAAKLFMELFDELVEPTLIKPTFAYGYPAEVSPLSRRSDEDPKLTDRFELFIAGRELANAFSELTDPLDQRARFEEQARAKAAGDDEAMSVDEDYLRAQEYGMPPAGGMGLGIDRLVMLLTDSSSIRDVLLFPTMRPE